jgi:hypothetical protein
MFQKASPASIRPARRPIRGSGLGGWVDIEAGDMPPAGVEAAGAHAARAESPKASESATKRLEDRASGRDDCNGGAIVDLWERVEMGVIMPGDCAFTA